MTYRDNILVLPKRPRDEAQYNFREQEIDIFEAEGYAENDPQYWNIYSANKRKRLLQDAPFLLTSWLLKVESAETHLMSPYAKLEVTKEKPTFRDQTSDYSNGLPYGFRLVGLELVTTAFVTSEENKKLIDNNPDSLIEHKLLAGVNPFYRDTDGSALETTVYALNAFRLGQLSLNNSASWEKVFS